jgi:hypothetical protein
MSLLHFEGLNVVPTTLLSLPNISALACSGFANGNGRFGGKTLDLDWSGDYYSVTFSDNHETIIVGAALKSDNAGAPGGGEFLRLRDGATIHLKFVMAADGEIAGYRGDGALLGTTTGMGLTYGVWRYFEVKAKINNSTGSVVIKSGGVEVLNLSDVDTQNGGNAYCNVVYFQGDTANKVFAEHLYFCSTAGSTCNDFLGDVRVDLLTPNAAGSHTDFTPSAGSNFQNVDDAGVNDGDTTYNQGTDVGDKDSYGLSDMPSPPANTVIFGTRTLAVMRKTDVGARGAKILTIAGATEHASAEIALSDSYGLCGDLLELNPADSDSYEDADINALEAGVEVAS